MAGWWACSDDEWPLVVELLVNTGEPWDHTLCRDDLAYHADCLFHNKTPFPSTNSLAKRWKRTRKFVGNRMKEEGWNDRQHRGRKVAVEEQGSSRGVAGEEQPEKGPTPATEKVVAVEEQGSSRGVAGEEQPLRDTGALTLHPHPSPSPKKEDTLVEFDVVAAHWVTCKKAQLAAGGAESPRVRKPKRGKGMGVTLNTRIKNEGAEQVSAVLEWATTSMHPRAIFLRAKGFCSLKTILRQSNFDDYADLVNEPVPGPGREHSHKPEAEKEPPVTQAQIDHIAELDARDLRWAEEKRVADEASAAKEAARITGPEALRLARERRARRTG